MLTIRGFNETTDHDYEAGVSIWNANWPDYLETVDEWKAWHKTRNPEHFFERLIGELDGQAVCYADWGESGWADYPGKHSWDFHVHPDHEYEVIGSRMYDHILHKIMVRKPSKISTGTRSDKTRQVAFVESRGYKLSQTETTSLLDVVAFDPSKFQKAVERAESAGLKMFSSAELKTLDPRWKHKLYDLYWEISQDIPSPDPPKKQPFEIFSNRLDDPVALNLSTRYVAVDTKTATDDDIGAYVALSNLDYNKVNKVKGHTGMTGVARAYRRKGIATAIKVHALSRAKADGIEVIDTDNDENNPMLDLNIRLGFKPGPAWLDYELHIE